MDLHEMFEKHSEEHLKFELIPIAERRHPEHRLCGMIYLYEKLDPKPRYSIISGSGHDIIWLDLGSSGGSNLTEDDVVYLWRCGIHYDGESDGLAMFS